MKSIRWNGNRPKSPPWSPTMKALYIPEGEIDHKEPFDDHIRAHFLLQVFVAFPAVFKGIDVEFRSSDEFTFLPEMPFKNRYAVMQREAHGNGEKGEEHTRVFQELFDSAAVNTSEHKPVAEGRR